VSRLVGRRTGSAWAIAVSVLAACAKSERVAEGPLSLDTTPQEVPFLLPVASAPRRDLCFEFANPRESHGASWIHVQLVRTDGGHEDFVPTAIDRRGETRLCFCSISENAATAGTPTPTAATYRAAVLWSEKPVRLRQIRWWSGAR